MKTVCIVNMKGGVAKTTLAVNLADCLSRRESKKTLIIDIDPQFNATQCLLSTDRYIEEVKKGSTVASVFDKKSKIQISTITESTIVQPQDDNDIMPVKINDQLDILIGDLNLYLIEMASGQGKELLLNKYIEKQKEKYDYVIIDTPPTPSAWMSSALIASDYYLVPVRPDPISIIGIDLLRKIIQEKTENYDLHIKCCGLVLTSVEERTINYSDTKAYFESNQHWKDYLYRNYIPKAVEIARLQGKQQTILDSSKNQLKHALSAITKEFIGRTA